MSDFGSGISLELATLYLYLANEKSPEIQPPLENYKISSTFLYLQRFAKYEQFCVWK